MGSRRKPSKKRLLKLIEGSGGIIHRIAQQLGCSWSTCKIWIDSYPEAVKLLQDETEKILDLGENCLMKNVKDGDQRAIEFLLSTKGKKRGFTTRHEVTGEDGKKLEFSVTIKKPGKS